MSQCPDWKCSCRHLDCTDPTCHNDRIWITPDPADDCFQPHSIDLTLNPVIKVEVGGPVFNEPGWRQLDIREHKHHVRNGEYPLMPGQFLLASTAERLYIPPDLAGHIHGKSSIGRRGVAVHITAGLCDAGWEGQVTLEVFNHSGYVFWLKPGMKICQITFEQLTSPVERTYGHSDLGSHYMRQSGPTVSVL